MSGDLEAIREALRECTAARTNLHEVVAEARKRGCTWAAIAQVFGVSRQAVTERFGAKGS